MTASALVVAALVLSAALATGQGAGAARLARAVPAGRRVRPGDAALAPRGRPGPRVGRPRTLRRRRRPRDGTVRLRAVPVLLEQAAALLNAGLAPAATWHALRAAADDAGEPFAAAARVAAAGGSPAPVLRAGGGPTLCVSAARSTAAAWEVCERTGAPLALVLGRLARVLRDDAHSRAAREVALAGPRATARVLATLPVLGVALGTAMGADPVAVLLATGPGRACAAAGGSLAVLGWLWTAVLVRQAEAAPATSRQPPADR